MKIRSALTRTHTQQADFKSAAAATKAKAVRQFVHHHVLSLTKFSHTRTVCPQKGVFNQHHQHDLLF